MKRSSAVMLTCLCLLFLLTGCSHTNAGADTEMGPFTQENTALRDAAPVHVDSAVIQVCYDYIARKGYASSKDPYDKYTYRSVRIGEAYLSAVCFDDESRKNMLDGEDYVIVFDFVNLVVDSDTNTIIGRIPLV